MGGNNRIKWLTKPDFMTRSLYNIRATKVSIARKSLFKVLHFKMPGIKLDISYASETIICFESKIFFNLVNTIQVFIFVGTTNFRIINIFIPFYLYLKNIDTLTIYLTNITNQTHLPRWQKYLNFLQIKISMIFSQ